MWSPRAEEIVTQLIAELSPEQRYPEWADAVPLDALHIGDDIGSSCYLRPNGEVVVIIWDSNEPEVVHTDCKHVLLMLVWGSQRYPALRELLPERVPGAQDCPCRANPYCVDGRLICWECCGLGWLPP
jgi:hypothetical protein